jgi:hypothetical protein
VSHSYDRIFKENIGLFFLALIERHLGLRLQSVEELKDKFQRTLEREPISCARSRISTGNALSCS